MDYMIIIIILYLTSVNTTTMTHKPSTIRVNIDINILLHNITTLMNNINTNKSIQRYVWYTNNNAGWGNQVRGMSSSLLLAMFTNRKLVFGNSKSKEAYKCLFHRNEIILDDFPYFTVHKPPYVTVVNYSFFHSDLYKIEKPLSEYYGILESSLNSTVDVIRHRYSTSFSSYFLQEKYRYYWIKVFGSIGQVLNYDEIELLLLLWLFQYPKPEVMHNVNRILNHYNYTAYHHHLMIQYRGWIDKKEYQDNSNEITCIRNEVLRYVVSVNSSNNLSPSPANKILVYITTDLPRKYIEVYNALEDIPNIVIVNTSWVTSTFLSYHTKYGNQNHNVVLSNNHGILDWFLLGVFENCICTGTTYCISGRARSGFGYTEWLYNDDLIINKELIRTSYLRDDQMNESIGNSLYRPFHESILKNARQNTAKGVYNQLNALTSVVCRYSSDKVKLNDSVYLPNEPLAWYVP